jgi:hypothetical protein
VNAGDGVDNDCDGLVDEEVDDDDDNDGDGRVDEDLQLTECGSVDVATRSGTGRGGVVASAVKENRYPGDGPWVADYEVIESPMPMIAVIISLCVALLAVVGVIGFFLLMELVSRRRQIRNTKIRPFVS